MIAATGKEYYMKNVGKIQEHSWNPMQTYQYLEAMLLLSVINVENKTSPPLQWTMRRSIGYQFLMRKYFICDLIPTVLTSLS